MDDYSVVKSFWRQVYNWTWRKPYDARGFVYAVFWSSRIFAGINTVALLSAIGEAPPGVFAAVIVLWFWVYFLKTRVDRGPRTRGIKQHPLPRRRP